MISRQEIIQSAARYFTSEQWCRLLDLLTYPYPDNAHIHCHAEGCISIASTQRLVEAYMQTAGSPVVRSNQMCTNPDTYVLQGVGSRAMPNWDLFCHWNADTGLTPAISGESCCNLLLWGRHFMERWYAEFPFREVGDPERAALTEYFQSVHWQQGLGLILDREQFAHLHINVRTSVHPRWLEHFARQDLSARGWVVDGCYATVYSAPVRPEPGAGTASRARYFAKLTFLAAEPLVIPLDLAWDFDPQVTLAPDTRSRLKPEHPGYDAFTQRELEQMRDAHPWVTLTDREIADITEVLHERESRVLSVNSLG